ncbi:MAG: right-handed parallel beta-helix repeat-containing protein, partial [Candidatus Kapabacteria bacterium]|nr:right-handed parallel beta-helix repeat-containing protein [Candidatus Kapabacteria bacterium]
MKKICTRFFVIIFVFTIYVQQANAKVEIGSTEYSTLSAAFSAINDGTHTGNIVAKITGDISETSRAILNASGQGSADYTSVVIYPTGEYKISGNQATALIELRGADDVTFDGRQNQSGTANKLTIENTNTSTHSVIWLDSNTTGGGGASNNTIRNINIIGGSLTSGYGIVLSVSTSLTGSGAGNDNNTIAYCTFKKLYYGIRAHGISTGRTKNLKIYGNHLGSSDATETVALYGMYIYYTDGAEIYDNTFDRLERTSTVYGLYFYYGNESKIYDNTISNFKSGSTMYGFYMVQSPYTEFYGNKVENMNATGSMYGVYLSTGNYSKFYDNTIKNITATSTFYGIYVSSNQYGEVYDNQIDNVTANGTAYIYYNSSCPYAIIEDNRATNIYNAGTMYGVYLSSGTEGVVQRNYFDNLMNSSSTSYGIYLSSCSNAKVLNNTVGNQTSSSTSYGIYLSTVADGEVQNNEIFSISANGTSSTSARGIMIAGTSSNTQIINNSIANIRTTQYSNSSTTINPFGIDITGGTGYKIWFNSVQMNGKQIETGTEGTLSSCLMISSTSVNTIDLRNNLFSNTLEGLSGSRSFCVYLVSSSNLNNSTMDYNNYYAGGTYGLIGYLNSDITDLSGWQSATSTESNSMNLFTEFNSATNNAPVPGSAVIGKGTAISEVIYDIIGTQRSTTNPTPGAYEKAADLLGPDIVFERFASTTSTDNRVLVATITDYTAVNKTSSAPRLYYRATKNSNSWVGNNSTQDGWKYATATISGDEYSFTLDYNKIYDGMEVGDVYEYFIVAKDVAPAGNISVSKGFFSVNPTSTSLTAENFPFYDSDNFKIAEAIEGEITVGSGSGKDYATLTDVGGVFEYLNNGILTGDVEVVISTDISESGAIALGKLLYEGAEYYNVTFKPSEAKVKRLSGTLAGGSIITLLGASYVTFDGSFDGDGRYLEITNQQSTGYNAAIAIGSGGAMLDGGKFVTIQNCVIFNNYIMSTVGSYGIIVTDGLISTSTNASSENVNNLTIRNNEIYKCSYGISAFGKTSGLLQNLLIENNIIGSTTSGSEISVKGIDVYLADNAVIRGNKIFNFTTAYSTSRTGIEIDGSTSTNALIENNIIHGLKQTASSTVGCYGINILGGTGHTIMNNYIFDITTSRMSSTSTTGNPFGIRVGSGSGHKIWHNTIIMKGSQATAGSQPSLTANIIFSSSYLNNDVRGNILHNSISGVTGT